LKVITDSEEEAKKLLSALKPDDVEVPGLEYSSSVDGNSVIYVFDYTPNVLRLRNAADEVLEHASLVEAIKGVTQAREG